MLISISGSQGCGKTTLLNKLVEKYGFNVIERKTSRSLLSDMGYTLNEINQSDELTIEFQEKIIDRKHEDEYEAVKSSDIWFTERSYADLFTYALMNLGRNNEHNCWLEQYYNRCWTLQMNYRGIIFLNRFTDDVENDGVRAINRHYSRAIEHIIYNNIKEMGFSIFSNTGFVQNVLRIETDKFDDRLEQVNMFVQELYR